MGRRGKQRAKQTKAAREMKYQAMPTDFGALQRELGGFSYTDRAGGSVDFPDEAESDRESASDG